MQLRRLTDSLLKDSERWENYSLNNVSEEKFKQKVCSNCYGDCCKKGVVNLLPNEYVRLNYQLTRKGLDLLITMIGSVPHFRIEPCPLLKDNRCLIYEDRPDLCKRFYCNKAVLAAALH